MKYCTDLCVIPQDTGKSIMCDGFLGQVVDLAETNVLNPRLMCVLLLLLCLSIPATHTPTLNSCTRFRPHGVGPTRSSIRNRYLIPAPPTHPCKVRWTAISDRPNAMLNFAPIVRTAPSTRRCDEDLMGQVPRLWNCLQAAYTD